MRTITDHIVEGDSASHQLTITVTDSPGQGGANQAYEITGFVTQEALLAIVIDRLRAFQAGPFKCVENELALQKVEDALWQLQERTKARIARGVEGSHQK